MKPVTVIELMPSGKNEAKLFSERILEDVLEGCKNPLQLKAQFKIIKACLETIEKNESFKDALMAEHGRYQVSKYSAFGCEIEQRELGVEYDYSNCNDPVLEDLLIQDKEISEKIKCRKQLLKSIKQGNPVVDPDTGAVLMPPVKRSETGLCIKIK